MEAGVCGEGEEVGGFQAGAEEPEGVFREAEDADAGDGEGVGGQRAEQGKGDPEPESFFEVTEHGEEKGEFRAPNFPTFTASARAPGALPDLQEVVDDLGTGGFGLDGWVHAEAVGGELHEGALGEAHGDLGVGGAEAVLEGFALDGLGQQEVEELTGSLALGGAAPGGVEDVAVGCRSRRCARGRPRGARPSGPRRF